MVTITTLNAGNVDNVHRAAASSVPAGGSSVPMTSTNTYGSSVWGSGSVQGMSSQISMEVLNFSAQAPYRVLAMSLQPVGTCSGEGLLHTILVQQIDPVEMTLCS